LFFGVVEFILMRLIKRLCDIVLPLAQKRLEIDLDDGVKVNYLKFKGLLETIPGLEKKEED